LKDILLMAHHVLLAHGRSVKALRKNVSGSQIGLAFAGRTYIPASDHPRDVEAARAASFCVDAKKWAYSTAWWADPIFLGHYPKEAVCYWGDNMPRVQDGEMELISQPLDFYGLNIYRSNMVESDGNGGFRDSQLKVGHRKTAIGWPVTPSSLRWAPQFLYERYKVPLYITENGLSCADGVSADGMVHDPDRIDFLSEYLACLQAATEYADIRGYFQWSLMDNFEWAKGYDDRFGLIYVDYETQRRILKDSAYWYKKMIEGQIGM
jgi:beta-glucosidase